MMIHAHDATKLTTAYNTSQRARCKKFEYVVVEFLTRRITVAANSGNYNIVFDTSEIQPLFPRPTYDDLLYCLMYIAENNGYNLINDRAVILLDWKVTPRVTHSPAILHC